jgi:hypothetical protein
MSPGTVILRRTNMIRRMIPLVVAIVLVVGCKKNTSTTGPEGGGDPNATYTIKLREEQKGDKTEVSETQTGTFEIAFPGQKAEKEKEDKKVTFTQEIQEMPAGGQPTKLTRTYTVAQKYDEKKGGMKPLPLEGKTVTIEKKGESYEFTSDGKKMDIGDSAGLWGEFNAKKAKKGEIEELLPKNPVKIGESWNIDPAAVSAFGGGDDSFKVDPAKSKMTGKLAKVYTKDGKQWGTIDIDIDITFDPNASKGKGPTGGTMKVSGTFDTVIDGSSREGTLKFNIKLNLSGKEKGNETSMAVDVTEEKTVKSLK